MNASTAKPPKPFSTVTPPTLEVMRSLVRAPRPLILDVGAKNGMTARRFLEVFPDASLHCFEPLPANFAKLQANLASDQRVSLHPFALARTDGSSVLHVTQQSGSNSLLTPDPRARESWGGDFHARSGTVQVTQRSLDGLCAELGLGHVHLLKLDVQGAELEVLRGAERLLKRRTVDVLFLEMLVAPTYHGQPAPHEILGFLHDHGYGVHGFHSLVWREGRLLQLDCLALRQELLAPPERLQ